MAISFSNIPSGVRVPLFYAEVDNSQANIGSNNLKALLIGQKVSSGKAEDGVPVLVTGDSQGKELFGHGSMLARMNSAFRENNSVGEVWAIAVSDPEGGKKASGTLTFSGTATAAGTVYVYIGADCVAINIPNSSDAAAVAKAVTAGINAKTDLPVTAEASEGVVTIQAKNTGAYGNDIALQLNFQGYAAGEELPEGIACEVATLLGGSGEVDLEAVITAMGDESYDFIAMPYADGAHIASFTTEMNDKTGRWSPTRQIYGHVYTAKRDTVSNLQAVGKGLNDRHLTVMAVEPKCPSLAVEVLGALAGSCLTAIQNDPARPLQTLELVGITPSPIGKRFTLTEKQTLLTSGIATSYVAGGYVRIERCITTYQTNSLGDADTSYLDSGTLHSLAYIIRRLKSVVTSKYPRCKLADDGTHYGPGQAIVTPSVIKSEIIAMYSRLETEGIVENAEAFAENLIVERNASDPNRVDVLLPPDLVNQLRIFATLVQFRLQYNE